MITGDLHDGKRVLQWPGRPGFNPNSSHTVVYTHFLSEVYHDNGDCHILCAGA